MHPAVIVQHPLGVLMRHHRSHNRELVTEARRRPGAKRKR
jgi:hypothetical protein